MNKVMNAGEVVRKLDSGMTIGIGGWGPRRKPMALVREIAVREPLRAVFRDSGFATDSDRINAEQVFAEVSPATDVKAI